MDITAANNRIRNSRQRTNLLKEYEFRTLEHLCKAMPQWVTPDLLTCIGLVGSLVVGVGLLLAIENNYFLILSILGFALNWFGDSLDGRLAYYRDTPRKWYGWALDLNADWMSICIIGMGFYFYFPSFKILAFVFVVAYGGSMLLSLIQYKIKNRYEIDKAKLGPTELRILVCLVLLLEMFIPYALVSFAGLASVVMIYLNFRESLHIMKEGDFRDMVERRAKKK